MKCLIGALVPFAVSLCCAPAGAQSAVEPSATHLTAPSLEQPRDSAAAVQRSQEPSDSHADGQRRHSQELGDSAAEVRRSREPRDSSAEEALQPVEPRYLRAYFQPRLAHVSISARARATLQIVPKGSSAPLAECANYCDFWALPGRYTLYTRDHETGERHELSLRIKDSARFTFEQGNGTARAIGAGLGIAGALSGVAGFFMVLSNAAIAEDSGEPQTSAQRKAAQIGLGLLLGSAVVTPIGWVMFGQSGPRLTELYNPNAATNRGPSLRLGLVGVNGGLGLGGRAVF